MKKLLLLATTLCFASTAVAANQGGVVKQTTIKYNAPTCENCKTTAYEETVHAVPPARLVPPPTCNTCAQPAPYVAPAQQPCPSCIDNNHLGIAHPLFFVKPGQVSLETIGSLWKQPKGAYKKHGELNGEQRGYDVAERIYYGLYDRLALKLQGGYAFQAPKTKQYNSDPPGGSPVPHNSSYDGTVGLAYHLIDTCPFDLIVGVDGTWGRATEKNGRDLNNGNIVKKDSHNYTFITPNAVLGFNWTPKFRTQDGYEKTIVVSPYFRIDYNFAHASHGYDAKNFYHLGPGIYIQPSKYFALDLYAEKTNTRDPNTGKRDYWQYNAGFDVYPYQNMAIGMNLHAKKPFDDPMFVYGGAAHVKFVF